MQTNSDHFIELKEYEHDNASSGDYSKITVWKKREDYFITRAYTASNPRIYRLERLLKTIEHRTNRDDSGRTTYTYYTAPDPAPEPEPTPETNYNFPEPATPAENARLIDWRFNAFTLTIQEVDTHTTPYTYSETYSQIEIINTAKPKGKANRKALVFFALPII